MNLLTEFSHSGKVLGRHWPVVFFVEKSSDFQYLLHLFHLLNDGSRDICYISSDKNDPLFSQKQERVHAFYSSNLLGHVLNHLKADHVIMTMPDLQNFLFKRSAGVKNYTYGFHAIVSTHQQYRPGAFDHYDTILCVGPHHIGEIRKREEMQQLTAKNLLPYGYPLIDQGVENEVPEKERILVAPSWYEEGILETCIEPLIAALAKTGKETWMRFHPEFVKRKKKRYEQIVKMLQEAGIKIDTEPDVRKSLEQTTLLITDRSGIAFEFALATNRPVIFIDTPPKQFNPEALSLELVPVEDSYRNKLGVCIDPKDLDQLPLIMENVSATISSDIKSELLFKVEENEAAVREYFKK